MMVNMFFALTCRAKAHVPRWLKGKHYNKKGGKDQESIQWHRVPHGKVTKTQLNITGIK